MTVLKTKCKTFRLKYWFQHSIKGYNKQGTNHKAYKLCIKTLTLKAYISTWVQTQYILNNINNIYKRLNQDCKLWVRNKNTPKPQCIKPIETTHYPKHKSKINYAPPQGLFLKKFLPLFDRNGQRVSAHDVWWSCRIFQREYLASPAWLSSSQTTLSGLSWVHQVYPGLLEMHLEVQLKNLML